SGDQCHAQRTQRRKHLVVHGDLGSRDLNILRGYKTPAINKIAEQGMRMSFSIARALSPGMNTLFAGRGYTFGGTLLNNTNISGRIESMNVWYKRL
ncbi:MAG: hypothetical protein JRE21_11150, partial [Deltaproteobacteria bacterium]|nr:hypothetical protein [Deltaproteobacteria bacterium]